MGGHMRQLSHVAQAPHVPHYLGVEWIACRSCTKDDACRHLCNMRCESTPLSRHWRVATRVVAVASTIGASHALEQRSSMQWGV